MALPDHYVPRERSLLLELSPKDLVRAVENTDLKITRQEYVPLSTISIEDTPIDEKHARDLGNIMIGEWGQTQSIMLRCRESYGNYDGIVYDIMDGYHRVLGLGLVSDEPNPIIKAEVYYNCSDAELYDQRILAVNSVKSVQFSRLGFWMKGAWQQTTWKDRIHVTQAFLLASNDSSGKILGLSRVEAEGIKNWVNKKAAKWLLPVGTIYQNLRLIDISDESLVVRVRAGSFGRGQLAITTSQLEIIATAFPNKGEAQKLIATYATGHGLSNDKISILVDYLLQHDISAAEQIRETFEGETLKDIFVSQEGQSTNGNDSKSRGKGKNNFHENNLHMEIDKLKEEGMRKEETIASLTERLKGVMENKWWLGVPNMPQNEKTLLECIFVRNMSIEDIAEQAKMLNTNVIQLFISAVRRYQIYKEEISFYRTN